MHTRKAEYKTQNKYEATSVYLDRVVKIRFSIFLIGREIGRSNFQKIFDSIQKYLLRYFFQ